LEDGGRPGPHCRPGARIGGRRTTRDGPPRPGSNAPDGIGSISPGPAALPRPGPAGSAGDPVPGPGPASAAHECLRRRPSALARPLPMPSAAGEAEPRQALPARECRGVAGPRLSAEMR
jgi:hypothetical protein